MSTASTTSCQGGTAVILGASGAVGKPLLSQLVSETSPYSKVYSFSRRPHPSPPQVASNVKYEEILVDFEKLYNQDEAEKQKFASISSQEDVNAVYVTMGTTRAAAGSMEAFERIDRGYVLSSAQALFNPTKRDSTTLIYCSSGSSNSSSWFPYLKSKGLTEEGLANIYPKTIIMRPGFLQNAQRPQTRLLESLFEPVMSLASKFSNSAAAPVEHVAKAMIEAAKLGPNFLKQKNLGQEPGKGFNLNQNASEHNIAIVQNPAVLKLARGQI